MNRRILTSWALAALMVFGPFAGSLLACPFCGEANGVDDNRTKAFELSIIFMLTMPALLLAGFGYGFYRLVRRESAAVAAYDAHAAETSAEPMAESVSGA